MKFRYGIWLLQSAGLLGAYAFMAWIGKEIVDETPLTNYLDGPNSATQMAGYGATGCAVSVVWWELLKIWGVKLPATQATADAETQEKQEEEAIRKYFKKSNIESYGKLEMKNLVLSMGLFAFVTTVGAMVLGVTGEKPLGYTAASGSVGGAIWHISLYLFFNETYALVQIDKPKTTNPRNT